MTNKTKKFFVMLYLHDGDFTPMNFGNYDIAKFATEAEVVASAKNNSLGEAYGFDVYEIGYGMVGSY